MGPPPRAAYENESSLPPLPPIDERLRGGLEVTDLGALQTVGGVLSVEGRQVLLYIPDHHRNISDALSDGIKGKRFHIADCKTLDDMRNRGRFERYIVTNNLSGLFRIHGIDALGHEVSGEARLHVCKNCLSALNYQGYEYLTGPSRNKLHRKFSIPEFFERYSSFFRYLPSGLSANDKSGYTPDWAEVSAAVRANCRFCCDSCGVDLSEHRHLLHVHHIDGVKSNNSRDNLRPLCADCHKRQPMHDWLFVPATDLQILARLRKSQTMGAPGESWAQVRKLCLNTMTDLVQVLEQEGFPVPEVGLDVSKDGQVVGMLELAWPARKVGVYSDMESRDAAEDAGWKVFNMVQVIKDPAAIRRKLD